MRCSGFSLVELLVVVSLIVVLLALLAPALDQSIYQAELTVCGARLDAIGGGLISGALERRREYPPRRAVSHTISIAESAEVDDRTLLRTYLGTGLNALLNCPLQKAVDFESPKDKPSIAAGYALWPYWRAAPTESVMRRIGGRWTYSQMSFNLLAQDYEMYSDDMYSSHPDYDGVMQLITVQDADWTFVRRTISTWHTASGTRGLLDRNFLYEDGSVQRLTRLKVYDLDERLTAVPWLYDSNTVNPLDWERVPRQ
jgi:prepilin-type N-terminal cleavage/methylation domain-containing protein